LSNESGVYPHYCEIDVESPQPDVARHLLPPTEDIEVALMLSKADEGVVLPFVTQYPHVPSHSIVPLEGKYHKVCLIPMLLPRLIQGHVQVGVSLDLHGHEHQVHAGGIKEPNRRLILREGI